jgi:hypothetical protein
MRRPKSREERLREVTIAEAVRRAAATTGGGAGFQPTSEKGQPNGYASLDGTGKVPAAQIPAGAGDAPVDAQYVVAASNATLTAERVATSTASLAWDTGTAGQMKANVQFGTSATVACVGNDARLSDARTPVAHNHAGADITSGTVDIARIPTGQTGTTVPFGNDARFSDARTPTAHTLVSASHTASGLTTGHALRATGATTFAFGAIQTADVPSELMTDAEVAIYVAAEIDAHEALADPHTQYQKESEKGAASGYAGLGANSLVPAAQLGTGTPSATTFLRGDQTYATPAGGGGSADIVQVEVDFGATPVFEALFGVVDANVTPSSHILMEVAYVAPTGRDLDEVEMESFSCRCAPGSGAIHRAYRGTRGSG